ncbi:hypothetical protein J6590_031807 [Homalodisca vitripennis]|nr:hypothetical protein J6590_031807 [Homalodisca vitripennis]
MTVPVNLLNPRFKAVLEEATVGCNDPSRLSSNNKSVDTVHHDVWFKNRRAKCRQQVKQHQQAQQHNGADKSGAGGTRGVSKPKAPHHPPAGGTTTTKTPSSNTTSSTASSPAPALHRDSPGAPYIKPLLPGTPPIPAVYSSGSNASIWSPAVIDSCVEAQRGVGSGYTGGSVSSPTPTTNCYPPPHQNYNPYYSSMDYLGPSAISHSQLNPETSLESSWVKREDSSSWFYNSTGWDRK